MSNGSLKEQLQAIASQFPETKSHSKKPIHKKHKQKTGEKVQKPKPRWLEYAQYGVELLKVYFPDCFKNVAEIKPLKKGIKEDLLKRLSTIEGIVTEDKACMVKSLSYYVNTAAYHKSVVEGAQRIDLDGKPAGIITGEEARYSVERQNAKAQAKKQAQQQSTVKQVEEAEEV